MGKAKKRKKTAKPTNPPVKWGKPLRDLLGILADIAGLTALILYLIDRFGG
jgi:hypothetical protein